MSKRLFAIVLAFALLFCGCEIGQSSTVGEVRVYRLADDSKLYNGHIIVPEVLKYEKSSGMLSAIVNGLNAAPGSSTLKRAYPENVNIVSCYVENGVASVALSSGYAKLEAYDKTIANFAITYSLFAIDSITSVDITCNNRLMAENLKPDLAVLADVDDSYEMMLKIFLPDEDMQGLRSKTVMKSEFGDESIAELAVITVLEELEHVPESAVLRSLEINEDGYCRIELSSGFYQDMPKNVELSKLTIYSIVNTLCYLDGVEGVTILVNGERLGSYGGYIIEWPLSYEESLIVY